jgi:hypothetical protein
MLRMAFRIDVEDSSSLPVLHVAGDLSGPHVAVLLDQCRIHGANASLSLTGLVSADEVGLAAIRCLQAFGVRVIGASPYFRILIEQRSGPSGTHD